MNIYIYVSNLQNFNFGSNSEEMVILQNKTSVFQEEMHMYTNVNYSKTYDIIDRNYSFTRNDF